MRVLMKVQLPHEPFLLTFNADVTFHPTMTPEDLEQADLAGLGKIWG